MHIKWNLKLSPPRESLQIFDSEIRPTALESGPIVVCVEYNPQPGEVQPTIMGSSLMFISRNGVPITQLVSVTCNVSNSVGYLYQSAYMNVVR